jgi:V-type H+-transporting ATPase subunit C
VEDYVSKFSWDEIKYPRSRSVQDNIQAILTSIQKLDEEIKVKTQQYTDAKQHAALYARKDQASHIQRDLVDLLTPENVKDGDFVYSEHLTTLIVVVPRGADNEFINHYHNFDQYVVPGSAERISADDKEGNSLWRVVMFKSAIDAFKTACRTHRYTVREFIFDGKKYGEIVQARQQSEIDIKTHEANLRRVCQAAFSDAMVAWIHMKAVRTFVEAVLRYGVPPNFGAFLIKVGTELLQVFANTGGMYGDGVHADDGADEESGEYYPYVYIPLSPTMNRVG